MNQRSRRLSRRSIVGAALAAAPLAAFGRSARAADGYTLRLSVPNAASSVLGTAALHLAQALHRRTNGQLTIEVYPNAQIAKEQEAVNGLASGVIDLTMESYAFLVPLFPRWQALQVPFLFKDLGTGLRVLDGPIGAELFADLEAKGVVGLSWGTDGFRQLSTTSKAIVTPEDMRGLRIRIQAGPVYAATYQALGAIPVAIDLSEVFTALQQRTIDGVDVSVDSAATSKYYTVIRHEAMWNSVLSATPLIGSKRRLEELPPPLQKAIREESKSLLSYWRALSVRQIAEDVDVLKKNGVAFSEVQFAAFRKAVEPVYAMVQAKVGGDLLERMSRGG